MSAPPTPRRWRFQLSLRTLLIASLLAGALMWTWRAGWQPWQVIHDLHTHPDAQTGVQLTPLRTEGFSPDGQRFFMDVYNPAQGLYGVQIGETATGKIEMRLTGDMHPIHWAQFTADGTHLFTASQEAIKFWNLDTQKTDSQWIFGSAPDMPNNNLPRISSDGHLLLIPKKYNELALYDARSANEVRPLPGTFYGLLNPQFSPGSGLVFTAVISNGKYAFRFIDTATGEVTGERSINATHNEFYCCAFLAEDCFAWAERIESYPSHLLIHSINPRDERGLGKVTMTAWKASSAPFLCHDRPWIFFKRDERRDDKLVAADIRTGAELGWAPILRNIREDAVHVDPAGHLVTVSVEQLTVWDMHTHEALFRTSTPKTEIYDALAIPRYHEIELSPGGKYMTERHLKGVRIWRHNHPEEWWGIFWMPQAWMLLLFSLGFLWSLWRDNRRFVESRARQ